MFLCIVAFFFFFSIFEIKINLFFFITKFFRSFCFQSEKETLWWNQKNSLKNNSLVQTRLLVCKKIKKNIIIIFIFFFFFPLHFSFYFLFFTPSYKLSSPNVQFTLLLEKKSRAQSHQTEKNQKIDSRAKAPLQINCRPNN